MICLNEWQGPDDNRILFLYEKEGCEMVLV